MGVADRAHPRDPQPRRPRLRPRAPGSGDRRENPRPAGLAARRATSTSRSTTAGSSSWAGCAVPGAPHARASARAHRVRADRHRAAARSRGPCSAATRCSSATSPARTSPSRSARARRGIFHSLHDTLLTLPGECEVWPRAPWRLAVRRAGDGHEDLLDDRLRARSQRHCSQIGDEDEFVDATTSTLGAAAAELPGDRRTQPRPACRPTAGRDPAADAHARSSPSTRPARCSSTFAPTCSSTTRTSAVPVCNPAVRAGFGTKLAWVAQPRPARLCSIGRDDEDSTARRATSPPRSGSRDVAGYLGGGMTELAARRSRPTESLRAASTSRSAPRAPRSDAADPRRS